MGILINIVMNDEMYIWFVLYVMSINMIISIFNILFFDCKQAKRNEIDLNHCFLTI